MLVVLVVLAQGLLDPASLGDAPAAGVLGLVDSGGPAGPAAGHGRPTWMVTASFTRCRFIRP